MVEACRASAALVLVAIVAATMPGGATAEQASHPGSAAAAHLTTGNYHSCALTNGALRCWGYGGDGALGYGNANTIGDNDTPGLVDPVQLGTGRSATALSAGAYHTCALLDNGTVRCWGFGANGRLGYGDTDTIGDNETPASTGPVNLGVGRTAKAISAGGAHACAVLDDDSVRCWGFGLDGRLGYGSTDTIGDNETPGSVGPVKLGAGRTAKAISAGGYHTCALLDDGTVRCWGFGGNGRLGYGNTLDVARTPDTTPDTVGPVDLGSGRTATAISAGLGYTCAVLDNGSVRCWGSGGSGQLGYGNTRNIGDDETPGSVGPVDLGPGRTAKAITAGDEHTCAVLDNDTVRCWGFGGFGQLGYGNGDSVGDSQPPGSVGPVDLGSGRTATAVSAGALHTCARLDGARVRCWGYGANGRLGYCNERTIGDNEAPATAGPVDLGIPGGDGVTCPVAVVTPPPPGPAGTPAIPATPAAPPIPPATPAAPGADPLIAQAARAKGLRTCRAAVARQARRDRATVLKRYRRRPAHERELVLRKVARRADQRTRRCLSRFRRTPGRVTVATATATSATSIVIAFTAPGSDGPRPPAATGYLVKQSLRPIRTLADFIRAHALCKGTCQFRVSAIGARLSLNVTELRRRTTYYYAIAARDNVSERRGVRSKTIQATTK